VALPYDSRVRSLGTLLGVWAHPDDETYLSAGLMASCVRDGSRVVCVTATRGEEGSWDQDRWPTATLGEVREAELLRSLEILGVTDHRWLDYRDGGCAQVPHEEGVERVRALIDEVRPRTVVTFGPDGMTGHADHRAVYTWTTEAFCDAAPRGSTLHHATKTQAWAAEFGPELDRVGAWMEPGMPPETPRDELSIDFEVPPELVEVKLAAIMEHRSQVEGMMAALGADFFRRAMREESFRLGATKEA